MYRKGTELTTIAYNGRSKRGSRCESLITGEVVKITEKYIWILNYEDGKIWKAINN